MLNAAVSRSRIIPVVLVDTSTASAVLQDLKLSIPAGPVAGALEVSNEVASRSPESDMSPRGTNFALMLLLLETGISFGIGDIIILSCFVVPDSSSTVQNRFRCR
jgi:hypothetical protein